MMEDKDKMGKECLLGKTLEELRELCLGMGMPKFAAKQIADWIYVKHITTIDEMTNLSKANRDKLNEHYRVGRYAPSYVSKSKDGTKKYLFKVEDDRYVETVMIPDRDRVTVCISSQVGCKMNCLFCMTGKQGFHGNLKASDILNQLFSIDEVEEITNIVYMGMGEPLDNTNEVIRSIKPLVEEWGMAMSPKRITLSTIGVRDGLERYLNETSCHLAISIHNPFPDERKALMPSETAFPIEETIERLKAADFTGQRRLSFEYIVFGGLNDTEEHMRRMGRLLQDVPCLVNLIRYHRIPNIDLPSTNEERLERFKLGLERKGLNVTIRQSRGQDIEAACGMLSAQEGRDK